MKNNQYNKSVLPIEILIMAIISQYQKDNRTELKNKFLLTASLQNLIAKTAPADTTPVYSREERKFPISKVKRSNVVKSK